MKVLDCVQKGIFYLDGGTGSYLQARGLQPGELPELWNLRRPEEIIALHRAYYEAGSHAVCTNTFGANALKYDGREGRPTVEEVVHAAVDCAARAREIARDGQKDRFIALDIGPLGKLLEPMGELPFERAVELFAQVVRAGVSAGADLILIETMNDCYETKAAVLAAKENSSLPIFVSNVYDETGKLMSGASPEAMVAMLEGLGVDAVGLNCSVGPERMLELLPRFTACCSLPLLVKPNAGLPRSENGRTVYDVDAGAFAKTMRRIVQSGGRIIGGCCGTTPPYLRALVDATGDLKPVPVTDRHRSVVSSYTHAVTFGDAPVLIGERINPTGKKRFKEALRAHDIEYVLKEGIRQEELGVQVLDVNVGLPDIDEASVLTDCVREMQSVCSLPLQLDTTNSTAMERAMRLYNGKPMINSVNGNPAVMDAIFPLVKKYGGLVVCLTLDESGIPDTAQGRLAIARRIAQRAAAYGIGIHDLIFDPLALAISSDQKAALATLDAIPLIQNSLHACCSLGVSNISFGLPNRDFVNATFFAMALTRGLNAAIMNPDSPAMRKVYHSYMALSGRDVNCQSYIDFARDLAAEPAESAVGASHPAENRDGLQGAIIRGLQEESARLCRVALQTVAPMELINGQIVPALDVVGRGFEEKTVFLPQLLMSAQAAKAAFEEVRQAMPASAQAGPATVLATVKGDIHDIGKNIVKALLENYGYRVVDLGRDVPPERIAETVVREDIRLVGLSALMTTTVPAMAETIALLRREKPDCKVVVGGAVLTREYAHQIGADHYAQNAMETVRYAGQVFGRACD
jgi:5-methyltetrahydrofolate--homocysteine methyltransferase